MPSKRTAPFAATQFNTGLQRLRNRSVLLRVPAQAIQHRFIKELNAAGFEGLSMPHMAALRFPSPDGARPGFLAKRAGMSKQAMNGLLGSLEDLGYIARSDARNESGARIVHFTKRGSAAYAKVQNRFPLFARRVSMC